MLRASLVYASDSYQRLELKYRSGVVLQQLLAPLLGDKVAINAEGRSLLIRAPQAEIKSILALVRSLDRPQQPLAVQLYRGVDPSALESNTGEPFVNQRWSTRTRDSRYDQLTIEEGSSLMITRDRWLGLPLGYHQTVAASSPDDKDTLLFNNVVFPNTAFQTREEYTQWVSTEEGIYLTPVVVGSKSQPRISLQIQYSLPATDVSLSSSSVSVPLKASFVTVIEPDKWQLISSHSLQSQPEVFTTQSKRTLSASTQKNNEIEQRVWVRIHLKPSQ